MESSVSAATPANPDGRSLSLLQRSVAVFTRPADAWAGLETRAQWWFPLILMTIAYAASGVLLHKRALVPMIVSQWEKQVQDGRLSPEQIDKMQTFISSPAGLAVTVAPQVIVTVLITLLAALLIWFGCGFVLGTKLRYRLALEVAAWSSLVTLPGIVLTSVLAWMKETMRGIHVGFGILLPDADPPSKLLTGLGGFLDGIGPLAIWYVVVVILGAAALSGAKRASVAWVLGGIYLALLLFGSAMGAMFSPAA